MTQLPIRRLTLYKQGIGYFERRGTLTGQTTSLIIPREVVNDALKSLNVTVHQGGQVLSVDYETPEDKNAVLAGLPIQMTERASLVDLMASLRGSQVELHLNGDRKAAGRIIGVESSLTPETQPPVILLQNEADAADIAIVPVQDISGITLLDDRAPVDIRFFLDVSRMEQTRATLTVRLSGEEHDLSIGYLAPSPTWRVSYRIISNGTGQARLIGWGLFENSLDEDLEEVSLTLMSGRPISFEYGLMESRTPARPQVSDESPSLPGDPRIAEAISAISHDLRNPLSTIHGYADLLDRVGSLTNEQQKFVQNIRHSVQRMNELMSNLLDMMRLRVGNGDDSYGAGFPTLLRSGPLGDLKVSSSYFVPVIMGNAEQEFLTYTVSSPVSVRRGQSAMVQIMDVVLDYEPLCVYNGDKMPNHPLLVWHLQNTTGMALEQGPVTIIDDERYQGEGLIRFTGAGDDLQIPYALEFGVLVEEENTWHDKEIAGIRFDADQRQAVVSRSQIADHSYRLISRVQREVVVLIERRDSDKGQYFEMPTPNFTGQGHSRWRVAVPGNEETTFTVRVRHVFENSEDIDSWKSDYVDELHEAGGLTDTAYATIHDLLDAKAQVVDANENMKRLQADYQQLAGLQEGLRKNLNALGTSEREVVIRNQTLDDLEASENRRREIESTLLELNEHIKQHQQNQQSLLDALFDRVEGNNG